MGRTETEKTFRVVFTDGRRKARLSLRRRAYRRWNRGDVITFTRDGLIIATFKASTVARIEAADVSDA